MAQVQNCGQLNPRTLDLNPLPAILVVLDHLRGSFQFEIQVLDFAAYMENYVRLRRE